jgi:hypothetical protein
VSTSAQANPKSDKPTPSAVAHPERDASDPVPARIAKHGDLLVEFDLEFTQAARLCLSFLSTCRSRKSYPHGFVR